MSTRLNMNMCLAAREENKKSRTDLYRKSQREEVEELVKRGCFGVISMNDDRDYRLYCSLLVDYIKPDGRKRSWLCVAACNGREKGLFREAPTIKTILFRVLITVAVIERRSLYVRNVTKAFVTSKIKLQRPIYMAPRKEMELKRKDCQSGAPCIEYASGSGALGQDIYKLS